MKNLLVEKILERAMELKMREPEPTSNKYNLLTFIWCVDSIPTHYFVKEIDTLYFINDRYGFFRSNKGNIVNLSENIEEWDTGIDSYITKDKINMGTVGTRLLLNVDGDIKVYEVTGFAN